MYTPQAAKTVIDLTSDDLGTLPIARAGGRIQSRAVRSESSVEVIEVVSQPLVKRSPPVKRPRSPLEPLHSVGSSKRRKIEMEPLNENVIEIFDEEEHNESGTGALPAASSSRQSPTPLPIIQFSDEELARRLAAEFSEQYNRDCDLAGDLELARKIIEEEQRQYIEGLPKNPHDEALALRPEKQEQREHENLMKLVSAKEEGIVFRAIVNANDGTLEDGSPAHPDDLARFEPWRKRMEAEGIRVKRFHWIVNYELEKRFEEVREKLRQLMDEPPVEIDLFHGTLPANIDSILNTGFRIGGVGNHKVVNGTIQGRGVYLGTSPSLARSHAADADRIFACRVLPGRMTSEPMHDLPPSTFPGQEAFDSYASPEMGIYVVRYTCLVLPCYMIEFERETPANYAGIFGGPTGRLLSIPRPVAFPGAGGPVPAGVPLYPPGYKGPLISRAWKGKGRAR